MKVRRLPEYNVWSKIKDRCFNRRHPWYKNYGGRGISICEAWRKSFLSFLKDVGRRPSRSHTIERIDNSKGYEPGNVRWATRRDQARNRRSNRILTVRGKSKLLGDWARERGMSQPTLSQRLKRGWSEEEAVLTPLRKW